MSGTRSVGPRRRRGSVTRRTVRVDPQFFGDLDAQLRDTRGPNGEPSASDFILFDLPPIAEVFADSFDDLPAMFDGRSDYRYLVTTGSLLVWVDTVGWVPRGSWVAGNTSDRAGRSSGRSRSPHYVQAQLDWAWDRTTGWGDADWEGRARMAAARLAARLPINGIDEMALDRFPDHRPPL